MAAVSSGSISISSLHLGHGTERSDFLEYPHAGHRKGLAIRSPSPGPRSSTIRSMILALLLLVKASAARKNGKDFHA